MMARLPFEFDPTDSKHWVAKEDLDWVREDEARAIARRAIFDDPKIIDFVSYRDDRRLGQQMAELYA